jgi:hypothetical protein
MQPHPSAITPLVWRFANRAQVSAQPGLEPESFSPRTMSSMQILPRLLALAALSTLLLACSGDNQPSATQTARATATPALPAQATSTATPEPTATPSPTATQTPTATPPTTSTPDPTPRPGADTAPQGTQTGGPAIDAIIAAIEARDADGLATHVALTDTTCTDAQGLGGPPRCADFPGPPADGSPVSAFPTGFCEGGWTTDIDALTASLLDQEPQLFAVVSLEPPQPLYQNEDGFPSLDHLILLEAPFGSTDRVGIVVGVQGDEVVSLNSVCLGPPELALEGRKPYSVILRGPAYQ